ncbi:MAG: UbiA family prenyltransferase [Pirellulales bacterium]|nr:UbiA family prenyltransferase [Pirellulales bacterium]
MFAHIRQLLELIRISHTLFALPFALLAALMAWRMNWEQIQAEAAINTFIERMGRGGARHDDYGIGLVTSFRWQELFGILMAMVAARSAAMAFNRLADRKMDALNPRTAGRHLPVGALSIRAVASFAAMSSAAFIASTLMFLPNRLPLYLSVPVLLFLLVYSYTKRFTSLAHFWLGAALMLAPISAWIAIRGEVVMQQPADLLPVIVLGAAVLLWVSGFDMIYACQDADFDRSHELHSVPARLGVAGALRLAAACHAGTVVLLLALPSVYPFFGWIYYTAVAAIAVLLIYEHAIVRPNDLARVNTAFFQVNAVISMGLLVVGAIDLWL